MKIKATIYYTAKETHPDLQYIKDRTEELSFTDTYLFDQDSWETKEERAEYIKSDLALVANGGYEYGHIDNVRYEGI